MEKFLMRYIILLLSIIGICLAIKCQVCESEKDGIKYKGVCEDEDDEGESVECKSYENLCFFTKTEVNGGGSTYYRNCFIGSTPYCKSYDSRGAHGVHCLCKGDNCNAKNESACSC